MTRIDIDPTELFNAHGHDYYLVLDARCITVSVSYTYDSGGCVPVDVYNGTVRTVDLPHAVTAQSIIDVLRDNDELLQEIWGAYRGVEWDGHDYVGRWRDYDPDDTSPETRLEQELLDGCQRVIADFADFWLQGDSSETILQQLSDEPDDAKLAASWVDCVDGEQGVADPDQVKAFVAELRLGVDGDYAELFEAEKETE